MDTVTNMKKTVHLWLFFKFPFFQPNKFFPGGSKSSFPLGRGWGAEEGVSSHLPTHPNLDYFLTAIVEVESRDAISH